MTQQQSLAARRLVDPINTRIARGLPQPGTGIADVIFPTVPTGVRAGLMVEFGKEHFAISDTRRAPGANTMRSGMKYGKTPYALIDHRWEGEVTREEDEEARAGAVGINLRVEGLSIAKNKIELGKEKAAADLARDASKYGSNTETLSGAAQWSDGASDPVKDILDAREVIRSKIGRYPNFMVIPPAVLANLWTHAGLLSRQANVTAGNVTLQQMQAWFMVPRIVTGEMAYMPEGTETLTDVWGNDVILGYSEVKGLAQRGSPSFGYCYQLASRPFAEPEYYDDNTASYYFPYTDAYQHAIVGPDAGFLFKNVV